MEILIRFIESNLDLKILRKSFISFFIIIFISIPIDLVLISKNANGEGVIQPQASEPKLVLRQPEPLSSYEDAFQKSSLFGLYTQGANLAVFKASIQELTKDLRLKGIVTINGPEAIIEDARTQKNTFFKAGDSIGELTVKEIKDGTVIISYYGEEKELKIQ